MLIKTGLPIFLIFVLVTCAFSFSAEDAFGQALMRTVGIPLNSHTESKWAGTHPSNGLGEKGKTINFINYDTERHVLELGHPSAADHFVKHLEPGETYSHLFTEEAAYDFHCQVHPWVNGNVRIGVWRPPYTPISELGNESFSNHIVWSASNKLTKYNFNQKNPQSPTALADIGVEFSFKPNFEYTQHIPCEITIHSTDVITLFSKSRSDWSQPRIDAGILSEQHVLNHEQKHFDIGEVVARQTEDRIKEKYVGKTVPCVSKLNTEFRLMAEAVESESNTINQQYDDDVYGGNPTLEERMQNQANWNVRVECFLEKRGFDSSCLSLTGTWTQNDLNIETKPPNYNEQGAEPAYQPPAPYVPVTPKAKTYGGYSSWDAYCKGEFGSDRYYDKVKDVCVREQYGGYSSWDAYCTEEFGSDYYYDEFDKKCNIRYIATLGSTHAELFESAMDAFSSENYDKSTYYFKEILKLKPNDIDALFAIAFNYESSGDYQNALTYYEKALSNESNSEYIQILKDRINDMEKLIESNSEIISSKQSIVKEPTLSVTDACPSNTSKLESHAYSLVRNNHLEKAMECFEILIKHNPDNSPVLFSMAKTSNELGNYDDAIKWISKANTFHDNGHLIKKIMGDAYLGKGDYQRAISEYDKALSKFEIISGGTYRDAENGKLEAEKMLNTKPVSPPVKDKVPNWVKTNAKWWADGTIKDNDFIQGLEYLVKNNIISVPKQLPTESTTSKEIPAWVKNQIKWWTDGAISEDEFLNSVQFLIKKGILSLEEIKDESNSGFSTFRSDEFRFSVDYPDSWYMDSEQTFAGPWTGIVWFLPEKDNYSNYVEFSILRDQEQVHSLSTNQQLELLSDYRESQCDDASFDYEGFECKNFEINSLSLEKEFGFDWYWVSHGQTEIYEDGYESDKIIGHYETPYGDDSIGIVMSFDADYISSVDNDELGKITETFLKSLTFD